MSADNAPESLYDGTDETLTLPGIVHALWVHRDGGDVRIEAWSPSVGGGGAAHICLSESDRRRLAAFLLYTPGPILRELGAANLPVPATDARAEVLSVLTLHRRSHNTRACTGCPWTPPHAGGTDAGAATRRRNEDFNTHLADLITALFR